MTGICYAMAQGGGAGGASPQGGGLMSLMPLILMFVIFYFLLIRPQQKKAKETRDMIAALKKGDRVITTGGIYGRITSLDDQTVKLEIADRVRITVARAHVAGLLSPAEKAQADKKQDEKNE